MGTTRNVRTYDHFCLVARSLEELGDRWSLLVIRDLLSGPRRFTDLMGRLGGITPKTLSQRLKELEQTGVVAVDREPGRREVRYALTDVGRELAPVIDALGDWGRRHAWRRPRPGEPVHPEHLLRAAVQAIESESTDRDPANWQLILDGDDYHVKSDEGHWTYSAGCDDHPAEVRVVASGEEFSRFILNGADDALVIQGTQTAIDRFRRLIATIASIVDTAD
ncbi:winged helix-turn-helix transcriptional regulator [Microbacterium rhizosphaerae]|uniref:Winged helix-turn-helix transcriptional regulator n=1 Tax=Microbacterium rhizosphaerae TaxID=1678237 RepID=A0ABZ0SJ60_9MICO|nr:winged helix-turn-helix transcriptional regulator [Microbacterium rhizosphaerae]WPR88515.1 winged helix-turn-helix transcriptional regulator [Microbacterium rhizosphaerae]